MLRRIACLSAVALLAVATLGLSACNTISGAGKDASAVGHDVSRGADATSNSISDKTGASQK